MKVDRSATIVMPALTFCSPICVKKSILSALSEADDELFGPPSRQLQDKLDKYYREFLHSFPLEQILLHAPNFDEFILESKCLVDRVFNTTHCSDMCTYALYNIHELETCWTLFHRLTANPLMDDEKLQLDEERAEVMTLINNKAVSAGPRDIDFETGELIRFTIGLMSNESTSLHLPISATLRVHDSDRVASRDSDVSLLISSNSHYRITAMERKYMVLPAPYRTKCVHYYEGNKKNVSIYDREYMRSHFDCINGCLAQETQRRCSCWPPEVAFVESDRSNVTMCDWTYMAMKKQSYEVLINDTSRMAQVNFDIEKAADDAFNKCTGNYFNRCKQSCPLECVHSFYNVKYEANKWPSDESLDHVNSLYVNDSALVSVIRDDYIIYLEYVPIYEFLATVSNAGGIYSMWISFTFAALAQRVRVAIMFSYDSLKSV